MIPKIQYDFQICWRDKTQGISTGYGLKRFEQWSKPSSVCTCDQCVITCTNDFISVSVNSLCKLDNCYISLSYHKVKHFCGYTIQFAAFVSNKRLVCLTRKLLLFDKSDVVAFAGSWCTCNLVNMFLFSQYMTVTMIVIFPIVMKGCVSCTLSIFYFATYGMNLVTYMPSFMFFVPFDSFKI